MSKIQISITLPDEERNILDARAAADGTTLARYIRTVLITEAHSQPKSTVPTPADTGLCTVPILTSTAEVMERHGGRATVSATPPIEQPVIGPKLTEPDPFDPAYDHPVYRRPEEPPAPPAVAAPLRRRWRPGEVAPTGVTHP